MLVEESVWYRERVNYILSAPVKRVLNIGSSTKKFRTEIQPYIQKNVFGVLEENGVEVIHMDQKADEGVDVVGDLRDEGFMNRLRQMNFGAIFCNNLLMHLAEKERIGLIEAIHCVLPSGGFLYLSTAHLFPYTADPFDSYYRPNLGELAQCFPEYSLVDAAIIESDTSLFQNMIRNGKFGLIVFVRLFLPFYKFRNWKYLMAYLPNAFKKYSSVCLILQKK